VLLLRVSANLLLRSQPGFNWDFLITRRHPVGHSAGIRRHPAPSSRSPAHPRVVSSELNFAPRLRTPQITPFFWGAFPPGVAWEPMAAGARKSIILGMLKIGDGGCCRGGGGREVLSDSSWVT